jgi:hypothetical protein
MSRMLPDHTKFKRIRLIGRRWLIFERTVYGPNSKTVALSLKGHRRVLTFMLRHFQLDGNDD